MELLADFYCGGFVISEEKNIIINGQKTVECYHVMLNTVLSVIC